MCRYGEVADVAVAVNNSKLIQLLSKKNTLEEQLDIQQAKLKFTKLKSDEKAVSQRFGLCPLNVS